MILRSQTRSNYQAGGMPVGKAVGGSRQREERLRNAARGPRVAGRNPGMGERRASYIDPW